MVTIGIDIDQQDQEPARVISRRLSPASSHEAVLPDGPDQLGPAPEGGIGPYLQAIRRHWLVVVAVAVLAMVVAGVTVSRLSKSYTATASILVTPLPAGDPTFVGIGTVVDTGDPARTLQTAVALIDTPNAAARAAAEMGRPWTPQSVLQAISVAPLGASDVISVSANAAAPAAAQRLANTFASSAIAYRASIVQGQIQASIKQLQTRLSALGNGANTTAEGQTLATSLEQLEAVQGTREPTMSVSQTAELPTSPSGASTKLLIIIALAAGLAIGCLAAIALDAFSRPVRDREEIQSIYPLPVLAGVPNLPGRRRGFAGTPPWIMPPYAFEQLRMLRVQLALYQRDSVVMVTSAGAGDGKTTVAAALAAAYAESGKRVMLLDLDLRKPTLEELLLGMPIAQAGTQFAALDEIGSLPVERLPGVRVMPPPVSDPNDFESLVEGLPALLKRIRRRADVVIIDTAPVGEVSDALQLVPMCDQIVFVVRPRRTDRRRLQNARDLLRRAGAEMAGLVLVGKDIGLPRQSGSYGYGYSLAHREPAVPEQEPSAEAERSSGSVFVEADGGGRSAPD